MNKPIVFLTGAPGNVGGNVLQQIDKNKVTVKAGIRDPSKSKIIKDQGGEPVNIDMNNRESMVNAMKGAERLLVVPPNAQNRAQLAMNTIEAGIQAGVKFILLFGIPGTEDKRISFHKEWAPLEERVAKSGVKFAIARSPFFQEMYLNFKDEVALPYGENGAAPSPSCYDLGRALARILENPDQHNGRTYTLTGPEMLTGEAIAKALSEARGKNIRYKNISYDETVDMFVKMGFQKWQAQGVAELLVEYAHKRVQLTKDVESITGKAPRTLRETAKLVSSE